MISVDEMDHAAKMADSYELPFAVLSDPDAKVHDAYKVSHEVDAKGRARLEGLGIEIQRWSKREHHKIAIPSMFLIDKQGVVRFAHAARDHRTRPKLDALLPRLKEALAAK